MKDINIRIKIAENGVVVTVCGETQMASGYNEKTYVYESLGEALKEIPSIVSVEKETAKDKGMSEDELDAEEKAINSSVGD